MKTLGLWMMMAATAAAQQDRMTEYRVNQMRDRLGLSEDQVAKVREIFGKEEEERAAKVNAVLNDEQRAKYEEMRRNPFGGGGGARGGLQGFQGMRNLGQVRMEQLKSELSLTDEQVAKIQPLVDEYNAAIQKRGEELRQSGLAGLNWQAELQKFGDGLKAFSEKIKAHLTEEQKPKADALTERATAWTRMIPGMMQRFQQGGGAGGTPTRASAEERIRRAVEALGFEKEEEKAAVRSLVEKVVRAQEAVEDQGRSTRDRMGEAARNSELSEEALDDVIGGARKERRRLEKELSDLQAQLADVLSRRQEAALIQQGILR